MEWIYTFLGLAVLFVLIVLIVALKIFKTLKRVDRNLELLSPVVFNLKEVSEKLKDNLDLSKTTLENLNQLITELRILPGIIDEIGKSAKDFFIFLKGQVEIIKDDIHFTLEDTQGIVKDLKEISSKTQEKIAYFSQSVNPLIQKFSETANTLTLLLESLNTGLKKSYIEISAFTTGVSEIVKGLKKILKI